MGFFPNASLSSSKLAERALHSSKGECSSLVVRKNNQLTEYSKEDCVQLKNGHVGIIRKIFSDGSIVLVGDPKMRHLRSVRENISIIRDDEKSMKARDRYWYEGEEVEVWSVSDEVWCKGQIVKIFHLSDPDPLVAHANKWYSVRYYNRFKGREQFKQLEWKSPHIRESRSSPSEKKESVTTISDLVDNDDDVKDFDPFYTDDSGDMTGESLSSNCVARSKSSHNHLESLLLE